MHRIINAHLKSFVDSHGLNSMEESVQFEMFVNYSLLTNKMIGEVDIDNVTTGIGDDGMDGIAIIVDEELIISKEDAESVFDTQRKNHDVEIVFIQSKRSESYDLGDFLKFKQSILKFVSSPEYLSDDEVQNNYREVFEIVLNNVPKIRNGKPSLYGRYATTGIYKAPKQIENAKNTFLNQLVDLGYFSTIDFEFIGRDEITKLWVDTYSSVSSKLTMYSYASFPAISGIEEAYLAVVRAKDFIEELLTNDEGNLRNNVFEENVRAFLGIENPVNGAISKTINDSKAFSRFPVLNNGITIVSEDVRVQGSILHLQNYQIVNGCQTSNVLFENKDSINEELMINIKVVETTNEDVFSELVRATNSQTKVDEKQFLSLRPISKRIEKYFNTFEEDYNRIFFERRDKQYAGKSIPAVRIFSLNDTAKAVCAVFLERPDLSYRYPKRMYELFTEKIFSEENKEIIFYTSALILYRLYLLVASASIPQNVRKYKWHIMLIIRYIIGGELKVNLNSKKIETYCQNIIEVCSKPSQELASIYNDSVNMLTSIEDLTPDRLKRQAIMTEIISKINKK